MKTASETYNQQMIRMITASMQQKTTAELQALLAAQNEDEYTPEAFEAMRLVLQARGTPAAGLPSPAPAQPAAKAAPAVRAEPPVQITARLKRVLVAFTLLPAFTLAIMLVMLFTQPPGADASGWIVTLIFSVVTACMAYAWYVRADAGAAGSTGRRAAKTLLYIFTTLYILPGILGFGAILFFTVLQVDRETPANAVMSIEGFPVPVKLLLLGINVAGELLLIYLLYKIYETIHADY